MDTIKYIRRKLLKIMIDDNVSVDKTIPPIRYLIKHPFTDSWYNRFYWFLCTFLEPNTNRLVIQSPSGKNIPCTAGTLTAYGKFKVSTFRVYMSFVTYHGILMSIRIRGFQSYYLNPAFVTCGTTYPSGLLKMFETDAGGIMGEHLFYKEGTMYKMIRGEMTRHAEKDKLGKDT